MVLTIEPGLYIPSRHQRCIARKWWGIPVSALRMTCLVTKDGCDVLSQRMYPKRVEEIEALDGGMILVSIGQLRFTRLPAPVPLSVKQHQILEYPASA